ncbi:hypothetical protein Mp_1g04240 [Marchantia polymorpha subsp. ruderalis]|uniref:MULE transposase domain-containing protein n=2 Tax=Marchantia polymorpha TaxID=3197 RepID=A0AAF6ALD6_MARPO|nr:hypothetical protein MARPO_0005s0183 [Marchantia polymorpha]BBM97256.1 hypothetical protein Mp_1g04240 [Marchantia polymorpha subsp. ruderalis]|eukprot:PTQ48551.1 hypothetical protein MARPO_0005s0183 [Marchantia polymorpha]
MLPPPEAYYNSLEEMMRNVQTFAHNQGYVVVKRRFDNNKVTLKCDRGGTTPTQPTAEEGESQQRRNTAIRLVGSLYQADHDTIATARTIYNKQVRIRQADLQEANYLFEYRTDVEDRLTHMFFAHPGCVQLLRKYPYTMVMNSTYKTNRFKMPMFHVISITNFNTSFTIAVAFLKEETEPAYQWFLQQLANLNQQLRPLTINTDREQALLNALPYTFLTSAHLHCVWHIQKSVVANKSLPELLKYLQQTWIPYKERFVSAWTKRYTHFGDVVTSRAEGHHASVKFYIKASTKDLLDDGDSRWHVLFELLLPILDDVLATYRLLAPHQQSQVHNQLLNLVSKRLALKNPLVQQTRGRPLGSTSGSETQNRSAT